MTQPNDVKPEEAAVITDIIIAMGRHKWRVTREGSWFELRFGTTGRRQNDHHYWYSIDAKHVPDDVMTAAEGFLRP